MLENNQNLEPRSALPDVASRIRSIRKMKGLSLDELAMKSLVSKSMISQIEGNKTNPTLAMIWKIAKGLDTTVQNLIQPKQDAAIDGASLHTHSTGEPHEDGGTTEILFEYTRKENFTQITADKPGVHFRVLTPAEQSEDLEIYRISIQPGAILDSQPHLGGTEEYLTLLKGRLRVIAEDNSSEMNSGDFIMYHADIPHSMENIGDESAEVHLVVRFR